MGAVALRLEKTTLIENSIQILSKKLTNEKSFDQAGFWMRAD